MSQHTPGNGSTTGLFQNAGRVGTFLDVLPDANLATESGPGPVSLAEMIEKATGSVAPEPVGLTEPEITPDLDPEPEPEPEPAPVRVLRATWGVRGFVRRATFGLVRLRASAAERAHNGDVQVLANLADLGPLHAVVASTGGGTGRTTTTLGLANAFATWSQVPVCAFEASESAGNLSRIAEGSAQVGTAELLEHGRVPSGTGSIETFLQPQSSGAKVLGSPHPRPAFYAAHIRDLETHVHQAFPVTVADTGARADADAFAAALSTAHVLVIATLATPQAQLAIMDTLARVRSLGSHGADLASRAVVVVCNDGRPLSKSAAANLRAGLSHLGVAAMAEVPFDTHIATSWAITYSALSTKSRRAWTHAAATVAASHPLERTPL